MAYQHTEVPVARSQEGIKRLLRVHGGTAFAAISQDDPTGEYSGVEGFEAQVMVDGALYRIRVMANVPKCPASRGRAWRGSTALTDRQQADFRDRAEKRIWRVLFYHLKAMFEASDAGVLEFREMMLPYLVTKTGQTVAQELLQPGVEKLLTSSPRRMLAASCE